MTILTLIDPTNDAILSTLDLDPLAQEVDTRVQVKLANFFPPVASESDWYTGALQGALSATRGLLVRQQRTTHVENRTKPLSEMTQEELTSNLGRSDTTIDNVATVTFKMPIYEENPEIVALVSQLDSLVSQLEAGHASGALLKNSDYEEKEPLTPPEAEEALPVEQQSSAPIVQEGIPAEALVSAEAL